MKKRILATLLAVLMAFSLLPVTGLADGNVAAILASMEANPVPGVAQIGETPYPSLADAMAAVKPGETIRLLTDCSGVGFYIDKPLTIDFNGCTYTVLPPAIGGSEYTQNQAFHIQYPTDAGYTGGVTFKNGTIAIDASNAECTDKPITRVIQNYVDLTLDTMTITDDNMRLRKDGQHNPAEDTGEVGFAKDTLVECDGGRSVFKNCTITAKTESRFAIAVDDWQAMCETGTQLTIVGGTVTGKLRFYSEGEPETLKSTLTFEDYTTEVFSDTITDDAGAVEQEKVVFDEKEGGGHKLVKSDAGETEEESYMIVGKDIFFRVGENYYKTFAEALAAAQSGDTVELLDDCDLKDENPELPENVTLDLGGRTLSCGSLDAATNGGRIIDSSDGQGKLKGELILTEADGSYCPIYDTDGYRFFFGAIQRTTPEASGEKLLFCFRFTFTNSDAYALLTAMGESVKLDFDVVSADGADHYRLTDATTAEYLEKAATDEYMICVELDGYNEKHDVRTEFRLNITGECTWKAGEAKETYNPSVN